MNRTKKNILMITIAVLLAGCMVFTAYSAGSNLAKPDGKPPMMQNIDQSNGGNNGNNSDQPPAPPSGNAGSSDNAQGDQPPAMPGNNSNSGNSGNSNPGNPGGFGAGASMSDIGAPWYILFGAEGLAFALVLMYLIMSNLNRKSFRDTFTDSEGEIYPTDRTIEEVPDSADQSDKDEPNSADRTTEADSATEHNQTAETSLVADSEPATAAPTIDGNATAETGPTTENKPTLNRKKLAAFIVASVLIAAALVPAQAALTTSVFAKGGPGHFQQMPGGPDGNGPGNGENGQGNGNGPGQGDQESSVEATGATTVDGTEETLNGTYSSTQADENAVLVTNGGSLISDGATISKKSGDSSNTSSSDFSGVNAGLLVQENSSATLKNAIIKTSAKGANAVFATGEKSKVTISDSTITTTGENSSRGLDATYGGTIKADNVTIKTQGGSCAAMATDRGEGTVSATNSTLETNGAGSPVIYSTGKITLTNSTGTANGAQITVVEGKNSATIKNSKVTCSAAGNRGDVDVSGIMIYQSMSGDADQGTGNFTAKDSTLSIDKNSKYYKTAPMFFVTNTNAVIDLENTTLNFGSGTLLNAQGTSEWGNEGSNGGNVTLNATAQKLVGDIQLDKISTLDMTLTGSTYKGTINGDQKAKSVTLKLDKKSKITLTGDSYLDSLEDADSTYSNIDFNGYTLYVNGKAIN